MSSTTSDWRKVQQEKTGPHIAFMERRSKHKPRGSGSGENLWGPILPVPDDLSKMQPFMQGPEPHFLLM